MAERLVNDPDSMSEVELVAALSEAERQNPIAYYAVPAPPGNPHWFECYAVEHKGTFEFLGFVARLGMSNSWEYDTRLPGTANGKGRTRGKAEAVSALAKAVGIDL